MLIIIVLACIVWPLVVVGFIAWGHSIRRKEAAKLDEILLSKRHKLYLDRIHVPKARGSS